MENICIYGANLCAVENTLEKQCFFYKTRFLRNAKGYVYVLFLAFVL